MKVPTITVLTHTYYFYNKWQYFRGGEDKPVPLLL